MKKILITGAGGFIGSRLVEILKEDYNSDLNILLRNIAKGARISCYPVNFFKGSITDELQLQPAMEGCDIVVHCAHDFANPEANLKAADIIAKMCLASGVKKLVYVSSFAIHDVHTKDVITENSPLNTQWEYAINKTEIEKLLQNYYKKEGLPVVVLRPTVVYGPFSNAWTISTVLQMLESRMVIPYNGQGICNTVYVDDVVHAIIQAMKSDDICNGESFIVSGPDAITWKQFYEAHLAYEVLQPPVFIDEEASNKLLAQLKSPGQAVVEVSIFKDPISFLKKTPVYTIYQRLLENPALKKKILSAKSNIPRPLLYPADSDAFETLSCEGRASSAKAIKAFGYKAKFNFKEGMQKTMQYIRWANLNAN